MGKMLKHNEKSGINVGGFVYTDVERVLVLSHELSANAEKTKRSTPVLPVTKPGATAESRIRNHSSKGKFYD